MTGEVVQAATVVAGSGAATWFADKVFGPSVDALGVNLKAYLQSRVPAIFANAAEKVKNTNLEITSVKPGLLARMVVDASFSEEVEEITDWWANLFISAAYQGRNEHAVFSDIMAVIGPDEAQCLQQFIDQFEMCKDSRWFRSEMPSMVEVVDHLRDEVVSLWVGETPIKSDRLQQVQANFSSGQMPWPLRCVRWALPYQEQEKEPIWIRQTLPWFKTQSQAVEILERARVLKFAKVEIPVMGPSSWVETLELTGLGARFYAACRGYDWGEGK